MADFVQTTVNKTALRNLAVPIANVTSFNTLIQSVDPIVRNREHYIAKVDFLDGEGKRVGNVSLQSPTIAAFEANAAEVLANAALATAMGASDAVRDEPHETYYAQLKCHDPSGDDYYVTFTRRTVRLSSFQDDAIKAAVETWADEVPELA